VPSLAIKDLFHLECLHFAGQLFKNNMSDRDPITQWWFDATKVQVVVGAGVPDLFAHEDYIGLSGAFSGSTVQVEFSGAVLSLEVKHSAVRKMRREINYDINTKSWFVYNSKFRIRPEYWGQDLAARSICTQARTAQALGFDRLSTYAVGNFQSASNPLKEERWSGYWVWPRLGFDGDIPAEVLPRLSPAFQHFRRVSQLMQTDGGRDEWHRGDDIAVRFDLSARSASWQMLERYTTERGIRG
jgi:hypothetical protein